MKKIEVSSIDHNIWREFDKNQKWRNKEENKVKKLSMHKQYTNSWWIKKKKYKNDESEL